MVVSLGYRNTPTQMSRNTSQMKRSYELVMAEARERQPALPNCLFRWSEASFDVGSARTKLQRGRAPPAANCAPRLAAAFSTRAPQRRAISIVASAEPPSTTRTSRSNPSSRAAASAASVADKVAAASRAGTTTLRQGSLMRLS